jgi:hypothetical protein
VLETVLFFSFVLSLFKRARNRSKSKLIFSVSANMFTFSPSGLRLVYVWPCFFELLNEGVCAAHQSQLAQLAFKTTNVVFKNYCLIFVAVSSH